MATPTQIAAWQRLTETSIVFTSAREDRKARNALHLAALDYGKAFVPEKSGVTIPFGRSKGTSLEEASPNDLRWCADALRKSIDDVTKQRFRAENERALAAIEKELESR